MKVKSIELKNIKEVKNFRLRTSEEDVSDLMGSIREVGLLEPIVVKEKKGNKYEIVAGFRRLHAFRKLGYKTIPSSIYGGKVSNTLVNLTENMQRTDVSSYEIGRGVHELMHKENMSKSEVAIRLGITKSNVTMYLDIYSDTPKEFRDCIVRDSTKGHNKKGTITPNIASTVVRLRKSGYLNAAQVKEVLKKVKGDDSITGLKIKTLARAVKLKVPFNEAISIMEHTHNYKIEVKMAHKDFLKLKKKHRHLHIHIKGILEKGLKIKFL